MLNLADHSAHGGRILQLGNPVQLVELETLQRARLNFRAANGTAAGCIWGAPPVIGVAGPVRIVGTGVVGVDWGMVAGWVEC